MTVGEAWVFTANDVLDVNVRVNGKKFEIAKFIIKDEFYINFDTVGQDAAEAAHIELVGQYVKLDDDVIDKLSKKTKL